MAGLESSDYKALEECLGGVAYWSFEVVIGPIYVPYKMGCIHGGGDWKVVKKIVLQLPKVRIVKYRRERRQQWEDARKDKSLTLF